MEFIFRTGALVTGIAPTASALAAYFCVSDVVLITQCLYYNMKNARAAEDRTAWQEAIAGAGPAATEDEPLLQRRRTSSTGLPGSQRRSSMRQHESGFDPIRRIVTGEDETPESHPWLSNALSVAAVYIVGTLGWFLSYKAGAWDGGPVDDSADPTDASPTQMVGLALGYLSAVCYLWYDTSPVGFPLPICTDTVQCARAADHQKLPGEVVRGPGPAILPPLTDGQPDVRSERLLLLAGALLHHQDHPLAARLVGHHHRGPHHLLPVPHIYAPARRHQVGRRHHAMIDLPDDAGPMFLAAS